MASLRPDTASQPPSSPRPSSGPTNDDIEAVIQMATSSRPSPKDTRTQLFVGNLPYRVRWQDLKDLFRKAGTVLRADVSLGPDNRSRGYGTVLLATAEDAGRAIDMFNGYSWQTRVLEVRLDRLPLDLDSGTPSAWSAAQSPYGPSPQPTMLGVPDDYSFFSQDRPSSSGGMRSLFVGNLPFHCQWQDLKDLFRQAGTILRADVALGPDGRSRGFGTVSYASEVDAERAVSMFNGYEYNGRPLKVHYDRYSQSAASSQPLVLTPSSIQNPGSPSHLAFHPQSFQHTSIPMPPPGYQFEFIAGSAPSSPFGHPGMYVGSMMMGGFSSHGEAGESSMPMAPPPAKASPSDSSPNSTNLSPNQPAAKSPPSPSSKTHHHPGPISLPPPLPLPVPVTHMSPMHHPMSPVSLMGGMNGMSPMNHPHMVQVTMTPHGLPPITPSMPSFNFAYGPQASMPPGDGSVPSNHQQNPSTSSPSIPPSTSSGTPNMNVGPGSQPMPPPHYHPMMHVNMLSPPMFSPGLTMSPGTPVFWTQARTGNAYINPAVGAPVHSHAGYGMSTSVSMTGTAGGEEPQSYFPPVNQGMVDYFWGAGAGNGESGLRNEYISSEMKDGERNGEAERPDSGTTRRSGSGESVETSRGTEDCEGERTSSSAATSWHADEGGGVEPALGDLAERLGKLDVSAEVQHIEGGGKLRTTSMSSEHPRRPAPGPLQTSHRADSDPIMQTFNQLAGSGDGIAPVTRKSEGAETYPVAQGAGVGLGLKLGMVYSPEGQS